MDLLNLNICKKVDPIYKKSFATSFIIAVVVYFTMLTNLFWGSHDWINIQKNINFLDYLYIGRFSVTWLQSLFGFKLIPYINCLLFIIISIISTLLIAHYWKLEKNSRLLVLFSSFWTLSISALSVMYYRFISTDLVFGLFSIILSIILAQQANHFHKIKKVFLLILSYIFLFIFGFGAYPPLINSILVLLGGKFALDLKNSNFSIDGIKNFFSEHKFFFAILFLAIISNFVCMYIFNSLGYLKTDEYNISLISLGSIGTQFIALIKHSFEALSYPFPYISRYVKILEFSTVAIAVLYYIFSIFKNSGLNLAKKFVCSAAIVFLFYGILLSSLFSYFVSDGITNLELRIDHFGYELFYLLCIAIILQIKESKAIKNIAVIIVFLIIWNFATNNMCAQKNLLLSFNLERELQTRLLNRLETNDNFSYNKRYLLFEIGHYESFKKKLYSSNKYKLGNDELYFLDDIFPQFMPNYLHFLSQKNFLDNEIYHCVFNSYDENFALYKESERIKELHFEEIYDFLMNDAKAWPDKNSVFVSENCIVVVFDENRLNYLKEKIKDYKPQK